jgi:hypothetical protein
LRLLRTEPAGKHRLRIDRGTAARCSTGALGDNCMAGCRRGTWAGRRLRRARRCAGAANGHWQLRHWRIDQKGVLLAALEVATELEGEHDEGLMDRHGGLQLNALSARASMQYRDLQLICK